MPWVANGLILGNAAAAPLMCKILELVDMRLYSAVCLVISAVGSAVVGAATNMETVVAGRVLMGIGLSGGYLRFEGCA